MKKLLRKQDILLLGISGAVDIFNDLKDPFQTAARGYESLYGWVPKRFRKTNYYYSAKQCLKTGYMEKVIKNGKPFLRLTAKGKEKIKRDFSFVRWQNQKWDKKWRIVIFDIEEKQRRQRDILRGKLKELGFGMIQKSVWISPYDIALDFREFVNSIGLDRQAFVMEVSNLLAGDAKILAAKIWPLEKVNNEYRELLEMCKLTHDRELIFPKEKIKERYLEILSKDPCLPKELLPDDWVGERVKALV